MMARRVPAACATLLIGILAGTATGRDAEAAQTPDADAEALRIVDCALPGQIRQLGRATTYVAPRRPVRTTARDCRIRGGEYVVRDRASLSTSLEVWLDTARAGDPEAQTIVGELFERGAGMPPDHAAAAIWYRRAADQGFARAQVNLGHLYEQGLGVAADPQTALAWYRRAAGLPAAIELDTVPDVAPVDAARDETIRRLRERIGDLEARTETLRQAAARAERRLADADTPRDDSEDLRRRLAAARAEIESREAELARQAEDIRMLIAEREAPPAPEEPVDRAMAEGLLAGPDIVLIEPELGTTRGLVKVRVTSPGPTQRVVGRITAPAGILSAAINAQPVAVNAAGVFLADVPVEGEREVIVTAIDRQGKRADLSFSVTAEPTSPAAPESPPSPRLALPGTDYALLIGNNTYRHLPALETPIADVDRIASVLSRRYGFHVRTLRNATRYDTLSALNDLRERVTSEDRVVVYYAGHGELDETNMRGHWLPVDAEADSTANWLSNVDVTDILNVIRARQILLVVDSCYSGTLTRSSLTRLEVGLTAEERATWLKLMARKRARVVLTSGGLAPVLDFGGGEHSVFARSFIEALEGNDELLLGRSLYQAVAARVAHAAAGYDFEQIPQYAPIAGAGHESGDFILQPAPDVR